MLIKRLGLVGVIVGVGVATSACVYDDGYGYGGMDVGYGAPYPDAYYGGVGPYGAYPNYGSYYGWYGDYYYPGNGVLVYDRYRRPSPWTRDQQRYWTGRRNAWQGNRDFRSNWQGFPRNDRVRPDRVPGTPRYRRPDAQQPGFDGQRRAPWFGRRGDGRADNVAPRPAPDAGPSAQPPQPQPQPQPQPPRAWDGNRGDGGRRGPDGGFRERTRPGEQPR